MIRVATFGGGTGQPVVLRALNMLQGVEITAVVSMADSGGSSGILRDERGILPPSDALRCLLALANEEDPRVAELVALCRHRFEGNGSLVPDGVGHTVGNVMMAGLIEKHEMVKALKCMGRQLGVSPDRRVLPSTLEHVTLCAKLVDGTQIRGETLIGRPAFGDRAPINRVWLEPDTAAPLSRCCLRYSARRSMQSCAWETSTRARLHHFFLGELQTHSRLSVANSSSSSTR